METKNRLKKLEDKANRNEAAQTSAVNLTDVVKIKRVNYRCGIPDKNGFIEYPDPPNTLIKMRHVDMTIQEKDGNHDN